MKRKTRTFLSFLDIMNQNILRTVKRLSNGWRTTGVMLLVLLLGSTTASAQRTMSGQSSLTVSGVYTGTSAGVEAFYSQYTLRGFWEAGITGTDYLAPLSTGHVLRYDDVLVQGGYMFRLAGTRNRGLNLYAGAGAFAGVEILDPFRSLPSYIDLGQRHINFQYGLYAHAMAEVFLVRRLALVINGRVPVNFSSAVKKVHWQAGIGLKYLFY